MDKFGLDDYTYNLLIEYFKSKPSIKIVKIFGSRILGSSRPSSDFDFLMEGVFPPFMVPVFVQEVNQLRHPYRIDLIDINSAESPPYDETFIGRNYAISKYFYKAVDYYPFDTYEEQGCLKIQEKFKKRWQYRYRGNFGRKYEDFKEQLKNLYDQLEVGFEDISFQISLFEAFKALFEGLWKTIKDYYKENGVKIFLPRQILKKAVDDGILSDFSVWTMMIYDFNIMTDYPFVDIKDELIYRLKNKYLDAIKEFDDYFSELYEKEVSENVTK